MDLVIVCMAKDLSFDDIIESFHEHLIALSPLRGTKGIRLRNMPSD